MRIISSIYFQRAKAEAEAAIPIFDSASLSPYIVIDMTSDGMNQRRLRRVSSLRDPIGEKRRADVGPGAADGLALLLDAAEFLLAVLLATRATRQAAVARSLAHFSSNDIF